MAVPGLGQCLLDRCTYPFRKDAPRSSPCVVELGADTQEVCHRFPVTAYSQQAPPTPLLVVFARIVPMQIRLDWELE
eukprot:1207364-Rhodomonas_salina.1